MPAQFGATDINRTTVNNKGVITVTEVEKVERFVQDGAPILPALDAAIQRFYEGEFMIDYERNLIVARSTIDQLDLLERIIEEFDRPVQQVLIEARFITVSEAAFLELGASWETGRGQLQSQRSPIDFTGLATPNVGLGLQESFFNVLSRQDLSVTMTALEQSGESQTISAPSLILVNNRPGTISDGKLQYYYEEYTVKQSAFERGTTADLVPQGKPTKINSGVELNVLASIGGDGKSIMLALNPSVSQDVKFVTFATVSSRDGSGNVVSTFDIILPESRNQDLSTRVVVNSGQTVVMGGVTQREQSTFVESVPLLGNLPLIGAAFRKRTEIDRPRYLLIFVTASLVSQSGEFLEYVDSNQLPPTLEGLQQALAVPPLQSDVAPTLIEPKPIEPDLTRQE
jgi:type IV pilus assembly protein PilQ